MTPQAPLPIGWKEYVDFPEWGVRRVRAKADTGAFTSSLDAVEYDLHDRGPDGLWADVCLACHAHRDPVRLGLRGVRLPPVRNPGGDPQRRPVIEAVIRLGPVTRRIQLTLARRQGLRHRLLLGRRALAG